MDHNAEFVSLLVVLGLAFLVPLLLNRFKAFPVVVGEILAGLILAQLGFLHTDSSTLTLFSNIGLAFLMFLAGLEIDIAAVFSKKATKRNGSRLPLPLLALIVYLITLGLSAGGSLQLKNWGMPGDFMLLALILGATSLGVVLPILKNRGLMNTRGGQAIFLTATIADFLTVILLTEDILIHQHGLSLEVLSILLILVVFFVAARMGTRFFRLPHIQKLFDDLSHATVQIKVRGAIVILLVFVVLAESMGVELILGAFLAGLLVGLFKSQEDESLTHKLEAFGFGMFIPIFFIYTGANLNISALMENPQSLVFLPALLGISILVKLVPALLLRKVMGWRETFAAGFLLNTHLSLEVAIAVIGEQVGLLSPASSAAIIVFAVLTVVLMPLLFNVIQPDISKEAGSRIRVIFGWESNLARNVANLLKKHGDETQVLTLKPSEELEANSGGYKSISIEIMKQKFENIDTVMALSNQDEDNFKISDESREAGISHIIALVNDPANMEKFKQLGVKVFSTALYRAPILTMMARNPSMFDLIVSSTDERDMLELSITNPRLQGKRVRDLGLPGDSLVLSIKRNGEVLIPHGNTILEVGDDLSILVNSEIADAVYKLLS